MFSISYLPTAERLTVVVVKARNLKLNDDEQHNQLNNVFVKVIDFLTYSTEQWSNLTINFFLFLPPTRRKGLSAEKRQESVQKEDVHKTHRT